MNSNVYSENLWHQVDFELRHAQQARKDGFEGKARVCARRAVSQALFISGITSISSLTAIHIFVENQTIPEEIRQLGHSFLEKVDRSYQLQSGVDLIENAQRIITFIKTKIMFGSTSENSN